MHFFSLKYCNQIAVYWAYRAETKSRYVHAHENNNSNTKNNMMYDT